MALLPYVALTLVVAALLRLVLLYCHYTALPPPAVIITITSLPLLVYQYLLATVYAGITVVITAALRPITTLLADLQTHCTQVSTYLPIV